MALDSASQPSGERRAPASVRAVYRSSPSAARAAAVARSYAGVSVGMSVTPTVRRSSSLAPISRAARSNSPTDAATSASPTSGLNLRKESSIVEPDTQAPVVLFHCPIGLPRGCGDHPLIPVGRRCPPRLPDLLEELASPLFVALGGRQIAIGVLDTTEQREAHRLHECVVQRDPLWERFVQQRAHGIPMLAMLLDPGQGLQCEGMFAGRADLFRSRSAGMRHVERGREIERVGEQETRPVARVHFDHGRLRGSKLDRPQQARTPLRKRSSQPPVRAHRRCEAKRKVGGLGSTQDIERRNEIVPLRKDGRDPGSVNWLIGLRRAQLGKREKMGRVKEPGVAQLLRRFQLLQAEFAHRLEQLKTWLPLRSRDPLDERVVHQGDDRFQRLGFGQAQLPAERLGRGQGASTGEDRQPAEQPLLRRRQQVVAPGDGVAHRLLPLGKVAIAAGQQGQPAIEPVEQRADRKHAQAGRRQLDRQR